MGDLTVGFFDFLRSSFLCRRRSSVVSRQQSRRRTGRAVVICGHHVVSGR